MSDIVSGTAAPANPLVSFPDFSSFQKRIVDGIKGAFGSLIPDEALRQVIDAEWKKFVEGYEEKDRWGAVVKRVEPELPRHVQDEIRRQVLAKIQDWGKEWGRGPECETRAREAIEAAARIAAETWHANLGRSILEQVMTAVPTGFACGNCGSASVRRGSNCPRCGQWQS